MAYIAIRIPTTITTTRKITKVFPSVICPFSGEGSGAVLYSISSQEKIMGIPSGKCTRYFLLFCRSNETIDLNEIDYTNILEAQSFAKAQADILLAYRNWLIKKRNKNHKALINQYSERVFSMYPEMEPYVYEMLSQSTYSAKCILALVLNIVPVYGQILAVILGPLGIRECNFDETKKGRKFGVAGTIISSVILSLLLILMIVAIVLACLH
ncbi:MAG: hypothetical protein LUH57_00050 [Ruminococcus sp.]|nr:hypothetical protein [Ruminococcus sp.]